MRKLLIIIVTTLAALLIVARPFAPATGMGARFSTPDAAFRDSLGSQGWLDDVARVVPLARRQTTQGEVLVYAGSRPATGQTAFGLADAKPGWRGWYAHGRFTLPTPPALQASDTLTCAITEIPSSGERFLVVTGFADAAITHVAVMLDTQQIQAEVRDGAFAALGAGAGAVTELVAIDAHGRRIPADPAACVTQ